MKRLFKYYVVLLALTLQCASETTLKTTGGGLKNERKYILAHEVPNFDIGGIISLAQDESKRADFEKYVKEEIVGSLYQGSVSGLGFDFSQAFYVTEGTVPVFDYNYVKDVLSRLKSECELTLFDKAGTPVNDFSDYTTYAAKNCEIGGIELNGTGCFSHSTTGYAGYNTFETLNFRHDGRDILLDLKINATGDPALKGNIIQGTFEFANEMLNYWMDFKFANFSDGMTASVNQDVALKNLGRFAVAWCKEGLKGSPMVVSLSKCDKEPLSGTLSFYPAESTNPIAGIGFDGETSCDGEGKFIIGQQDTGIKIPIADVFTKIFRKEEE